MIEELPPSSAGTNKKSQNTVKKPSKELELSERSHKKAEPRSAANVQMLRDKKFNLSMSSSKMSNPDQE